MAELIKPILESLGMSSVDVAIVIMLFKLNSMINVQRAEVIKQCHSLDKRVTVLEVKKDV